MKQMRTAILAVLAIVLLAAVSGAQGGPSDSTRRGFLPTS